MTVAGRTTRVLYLAHSVDAAGGGMERMGHALLTYGADAEFAVIASEGLAALPPEVHGVQLWLPRRPAFLRILLFYVRSGRLVRELRRDVDVVHACGAITRERVDVATVHLCHAGAPRSPATGPRWRRVNGALARRVGLHLERRQLGRGRTGRVVAVSPTVEAELAAHYPRVPRTMIPNGVDVTHWRAERSEVPTGDLAVVMVTGDFATKGVDIAIEAVARAPGVSLRVVGGGPAHHYEQRAAELGIAARVTFTGTLADPAPVYAASDVVLCCSRYESFGLYLLEGALAGCAVVSTPVGVGPDLVGGGAGGVLVDATPDSIADALLALSADRAHVRALGRAAAARADRYSLDAMVARYDQLYDDVAGGCDRPRHVVHVGLESPAVRVGGLNNYLSRLVGAERAAGARADVIWIADDSSDGAVAVAPGQSWPARWIAFARAVRRSRADVVDVHFPAHAWAALWLGVLRRRPLVVHFQGPWAAESRATGGGAGASWVKFLVEGQVLRRADLVVTLSSAFKRVAVERYRVPPHRVVVIAPGVDAGPAVSRESARAALGVPGEDTVWLAVRRLVPRMGLDVAIEAFATGGVARRRLVIIGDGPVRAELEHRAHALGVDAVVTFAGPVDDETLNQWYAAADVSVVPSRSLEGFGLVVLESLARGTPVAAADVDGLRDAARGSRAVELCGPTAAELASAVTALLARPGVRDDALATAARYRWSEVAATHLALYDELVGGRTRRGVVVLDHSAAMSGGELAIARLLTALDPRWQSHVVLAEDGPLVLELERRRISTEVLAMDARTRALARDSLGRHGALRAARDTLGYAWRLRRRLRALDPDIVHTNSMKAHVYGEAASVFAPWSTVMHVRDRWEPPYLSESVADDLRLLARFGPDLVIANSRSTAHTVASRAVVLPSPVEAELFGVARALPSATLRLALVGRLAPWKGQLLALDALALLPTLACTLTIVGAAQFGEDEYAASLRDHVHQLGLEKVVTLIGHVDDIASVLAEVDVALLTSLSPEPFGNVVVEAMAAGRPVIVPNRGGVTEYVIDDVEAGSGYFYEMGDAAALAGAIQRAAADPADRARRGERARVTAGEFRAEAVAARLVGLYDGLR